MKFTIKEGDIYPRLRHVCVDEDGEVVDLTGVQTVTFFMRDLRDTDVITNAAAIIVSAPNGIVEYQWVSADTDTSGRYIAEFQANYSGGARTFPPDGYILVEILEDIV